MLKRGDKVYARIVRNCSVSELTPIIQGKADTDAVIYSDGFKTYDGLADYGYKRRYRVKHGENEGDKVYARIVRNCSASELTPIIKDKADTDAVIYSDGFKTYDGLADYGYKRRYRVKRGENEFADGHYPINGIENFWSSESRDMLA